MELTMEPNPAQKKRAKRIQRKFITKIRIYQPKSKPDDSPKWSLVTTRNLSANGIFFNYNKNIPIINSILLLCIINIIRRRLKPYFSLLVGCMILCP